jgi:ADP-ribose pyrophosphatase YjhB (NUDIX family)
MDFMRGKYPIYNKRYILNIINEMTITEKNLLLENTFDDLWKYIWGKTITNYSLEEKTSCSKFISLKNGINKNNIKYDLISLINESTTSWDDPEWGFPKGRRDHLEKDISCGIREFEEETPYKKNQLTIIQNIMPYEEIFTGSNYKSYKHKYYLAFMNNVYNIELDTYTNNEVGKIGWYKYEDVCKLIRPYDLEKLTILDKINNVLKKYRLYI